MIALPWNQGETLSVPLPDQWRSLGSYVPSEVQLPESFEKLLSDRLDDPTESSPLRTRDMKGCKVTVVIDDSTRPTPVHRMFPVVLRHLEEAGVNRKDVTVLVALGTHVAMSREAVLERIGMEEGCGLEIANHDCHDAKRLVDLGVTSFGTRSILNRLVCEADLTVLIGTVEPHLIAGFGGGLKNIIPGCAGMEAIAGTHLKVKASERFGVVGFMGEECATRQAIEEGALKASCDYFVVNSVLDGKGRPVDVFCGHPVSAHRAGCRKAAEVYGAKIGEKADVLITGAWPMTYDFRQATKCLANGLGALREDGIILAFMNCSHGVGDVIVGDSALTGRDSREVLRELGTEGYVRERLSGRPSPHMDEVYMIQFMAEIYRRHRILVYAPDLPAEFGERLDLFPFFSDVEEMMAEAERMVPRGTVWVSPFGGTCYPVFAG